MRLRSSSLSSTTRMRARTRFRLRLLSRNFGAGLGDGQDEDEGIEFLLLGVQIEQSIVELGQGPGIGEAEARSGAGNGVALVEGVEDQLRLLFRDARAVAVHTEDCLAVFADEAAIDAGLAVFDGVGEQVADDAVDGMLVALDVDGLSRNADAQPEPLLLGSRLERLQVIPDEPAKILVSL